MKFDPAKHHRRAMRLKDYDYSQNGAYFVTICVQNRLCLFGEIVDQEMQMNSAGEVIYEWWQKLPEKFSSISLDTAIVMPNHFHGIVLITDQRKHELPDLMQWFKTMTTNAYIQGVKQAGWAEFPGKLWQRSYYDHIIRNEHDLSNIRLYIEGNPARWMDDEHYSTNLCQS